MLGALEQVADDEDWYRCLYVHPQNPQDVLYRVEFTVVPPGVGRPSSGNCGGTPTPGYLGTVKETEIESVKRYLSVDGGATRVSSDIAGGTLALWQSVLAQAEAQEIGQACP